MVNIDGACSLQLAACRLLQHMFARSRWMQSSCSMPQFWWTNAGDMKAQLSNLVVNVQKCELQPTNQERYVLPEYSH